MPMQPGYRAAASPYGASVGWVKAASSQGTSSGKLSHRYVRARSSCQLQACFSNNYSNLHGPRGTHGTPGECAACTMPMAGLAGKGAEPLAWILERRQEDFSLPCLLDDLRGWSCLSGKERK